MKARIDNSKTPNTSAENGRITNKYFAFAKWEHLSICDLAFSEVEFEGLGADSAEFLGCSFTNVLLYDVDGDETVFRGATFKEVSFLGCNLSHAIFDNCTFDSVVFASDNIGVKSNLSGANLESCLFRNVELSTVIYDRKTKFPRGFEVKRRR